MGLKGFRKQCPPVKGGIKSVALVYADALTGIECDQSRSVCTQITLKHEERFAVYEFAEGTAFYDEEISLADGSVSVRHTLGFVLEGEGDGLRAAAAQMASRGVMALVVTRSEEVLLAGYSPAFGTERAMRPSSMTVATGRGGDTVSARITLISADNATAIPYTGGMEHIIF